MCQTPAARDLHPAHAPSERLADPQGCQNALLDDHSGGFRIKALRPAGGLVRECTFEVRPFKFVRPKVMFAPARRGEKLPGEVRTSEVRLGEVRPWFDRVAIDLHGNHATADQQGCQKDLPGNHSGGSRGL